jgi:adenylate cyclase
MEFTAIGSTVNLASRIESLTKEAGVPLLLTGDTHSALSTSDGVHELAPRRVRGVEEPVALFSI